MSFYDENDKDFEERKKKSHEQLKQHLEACKPFADLERMLNEDLGRNNPFPDDFDDAWDNI